MKKSVKGIRGIRGITVIITGILIMGLLSGCASAKPVQALGEEASRLDAIKAKGVLSVVMEPYFAPNEFVDPSKSGDDQYVGSDVELAKYIADKLGVELEIVPLEFSAVLSSITEGKYDLAISALAYTPAPARLPSPISSTGSTRSKTAPSPSTASTSGGSTNWTCAVS